ncbi:MurT ligase domain-containing protein [Conexibacter sp. SYSU D00693]|uniref:MurT ligase domain-containing protein n=1 Tax=Conexibacter sp. SYSU D00693 TaxID=2812560 RepID=UPI00196BA8E7|nr:MurT ligase domain-containing protein [Conexibacter sp. SYSU D00693]
MSGGLAWKAAVARGAGALSRRSGRGGTSLPGKVLLRLAPDAIGRLASGLSRGTAVISATNGKTTTAAMVAAVLEHGGVELVHNRQGANMAGGVASSLLAARGHGDFGLFEVDEFWLDRIEPELAPKAILLANLFRDQLDRYGELETIADRWAAVAASTRAQLVLNADDPLVADLGRGRDAVFFGVEDRSLAMAQMQHAADAKHCRTCGSPYRYDAIFLGHLGHFHCDVCGATRPVPSVSAQDVVLDGVRGARFSLVTPAGRAEVSLPLPGLYNVYNALGAAALGLSLGASLDDVVAGLHAVAPAFGRAESVRMGGRDVLLLLVKNPAGANEVLRTLVLEEGEHDLLAVLNDRTADGKDVSWVWDADFEVLAPKVRRVVCAGTRAPELALRLKYAGVPEDRIVVEAELDAALDLALADGSGRLVAIPTYTAMLELRELLASRGVVRGQFT